MPTVLRVRHYLMSRYRFRRNSVSGRIEYAPSACETACEGDVHPFIPLDKAHKHSLQLELAEAGKSIPEYKSIPILLLTTEINEEKRQKSKLVGITGWIQKPFVIDKFLSFIKKALQ